MAHSRTLTRTALLLSLGLAASGARAQPAPTSKTPPPLIVTMGPRQAPWKRVFNPFLKEEDTRWPSVAGIYEPLIVYNRATGAYVPWLATSFQWSADNTKLRFALRSGCRVVGRHPLHRGRRRVHLRPHASVSRARSPGPLAVPRERHRRRRGLRRVRLQADLHPGSRRHRHPAHRFRAQMEGRGPARLVRRREPGGLRDPSPRCGGSSRPSTSSVGTRSIGRLESPP